MGPAVNAAIDILADQVVDQLADRFGTMQGNFTQPSTQVSNQKTSTQSAAVRAGFQSFRHFMLAHGLKIECLEDVEEGKRIFEDLLEKLNEGEKREKKAEANKRQRDRKNESALRQPSAQDNRQESYVAEAYGVSLVRVTPGPGYIEEVDNAYAWYG